MNGLDRQTALKMMDLHPDATKDEIAKRYGILTRKFRTITKDENGYTIQEITEAYNLLMGITFSDEKEMARQKALRENPPLLARVLKKDPVKLENFFHYNKWYMLIGLVVILLLIFTIRSCINRVEPDFSLVVTGALYMENDSVTEADIRQKLPELTAPQVNNLASDPNDAQYHYAVQMKLMAMLSAAEIDVILMDQDNFDLLSGQGVLLPLEEYMSSLPFSAEDYAQGVQILEQPVNGDPIYASPAAYGVDITESEFSRKNGIYGERIIAGIVINSKHMDAALKLLGQLKP